MPAALTDSSQIICEVWASNVEEEMRKIRQIIQSYNYVAMVGEPVCSRRGENVFCIIKTVHILRQDTEFPGVVVRPIGEFRSTVDYQYQLLRCNVDLLKIIQLGLTFMNEDGDYPAGTTTWQFNFKFNLTWVNSSRRTRSKSLLVFFSPVQTSFLLCCWIFFFFLLRAERTCTHRTP